MSRSLCRSLSVAALAVIFFPGMAPADDFATPHETAQRLADQALAERKKADRLETGWQEVYDHGIELATQAIALDPSVADAHYALFVNLGKKSERTGVGAQLRNISHLKELLNKTLELDPRHAAELAPRWSKPQLRLAEVDWKNGRAAEARTEAERARDFARESGDDDLLGDAEALLRKMGGS